MGCVTREFLDDSLHRWEMNRCAIKAEFCLLLRRDGDSYTLLHGEAHAE